MGADLKRYELNGEWEKWAKDPINPCTRPTCYKIQLNERSGMRHPRRPKEQDKKSKAIVASRKKAARKSKREEARKK